MDFEIAMTGLWWGPLRFAALDLKALDLQPVRCQRCWSRDCAAVLPSSRLDRFLLRRLRVPFECRNCGRHFRQFDVVEAERLAGLMAAKLEAIEAGAPVDRRGEPLHSSTG